MHLMQLESVLILERKLFEIAFLTILLESYNICSKYFGHRRGCCTGVYWIRRALVILKPVSIQFFVESFVILFSSKSLPLIAILCNFQGFRKLVRTNGETSNDFHILSYSLKNVEKKKNYYIL